MPAPRRDAMNLFILHANPKEAAQAHVDKHVVKMILETCQMLYTAHWTAAYPGLVIKAKKGLTPPSRMATAPAKKDSQTRGYTFSHINHPCTKWIRASLENYLFACELGIALGEEYTYRWGKTHACAEHVKWLKENPPALKSKGLTPFAIAMDDKYKNSADAIECYRNYYLTAKKDKGLLHYTRREAPVFVSMTLQTRTGESYEVRANTEAGALASGHSDAGRYNVEDGKDGRRDDAEGEDLVKRQGATRDKERSGGDEETLN